MSYMRSEPSDGSSQVGRFLVGVERPGRRREIRVVEEQSSVAADAFQLVVVGRMVPGASDAGSTGRGTGSSAVRRRLFIGPIPIGERERERKSPQKGKAIHNYFWPFFLLSSRVQSTISALLTTVERNLPFAPANLNFINLFKDDFYESSSPREECGFSSSSPIASSVYYVNGPFSAVYTRTLRGCLCTRSYKAKKKVSSSSFLHFLQKKPLPIGRKNVGGPREETVEIIYTLIYYSIIYIYKRKAHSCNGALRNRACIYIHKCMYIYHFYLLSRSFFFCSSHASRRITNGWLQHVPINNSSGKKKNISKSRSRER